MFLYVSGSAINIKKVVFFKQYNFIEFLTEFKCITNSLYVRCCCFFRYPRDTSNRGHGGTAHSREDELCVIRYL